MCIFILKLLFALLITLGIVSFFSVLGMLLMTQVNYDDIAK